MKDVSFPLGRAVLALAAMILFTATAGAAPAAGSLDLSFEPGYVIDHAIDAAAEQADGKWVIGGRFQTVHGAIRPYLARLNPDGSTDHSFLAGLEGPDNRVWAVAIQPDGGILIGGFFLHVNGEERHRIARLHPDGSLDDSFQADLTGAIGAVINLHVLDDGSFLATGNFNRVLGEGRPQIARFQADGAPDETFATDLLGSIVDLAVRPDGKILVSGSYFRTDTLVNRVSRDGIARLHPDGKLDPTFEAELSEPGTGFEMRTIALQPDGKVIAGGSFTTHTQGRTNHALVRFHEDGALDTSFDANLTPSDDPWISSVAVQAGGRVLIGGEFKNVQGFPRDGFAGLTPEGTLDESFVEGVPLNERSFNTVRGIHFDAAGRIVLRGSTRTELGLMQMIRLEASGGLDTSFRPGSGGPLGSIRAVAVEPDGRILIGGSFGLVDGESRHGAARLHVDGSLDPSFVNGRADAPGSSIEALVRQQNGKVLIGGRLAEFDEVPHHGVERLHADGQRDENFTIAETNGEVYALAVQDDGKILVAGRFTLVHGQARSRIARLNADGTLDTTFGEGISLLGAGTEWSTVVQAVAQQPDGRIIIGGQFAMVNGEPRFGIARLEADGSLDRSFGEGMAGIGDNRSVYSLALQGDGKILMGGFFSSINGVPWDGTARLHPDGSLDRDFSGPSGGGGRAYALALQPDGKVIMVGNIFSVHGQPRGRIARLNPDGTLDRTFAEGMEGAHSALPLAVALHGDKVIVGGQFTWFNGLPRRSIARLHNDISVFIDPFAAWAAALPEDFRGENDDPGGHGIPNLLRYAFAMDALHPAREQLPRVSHKTLTEQEDSSTYLTITYTRRTDDPALVFETEVSDDLLAWEPFTGVEAVEVDDANGSERVTVAHPVPVEDDDRRFLRIRVNQ
jgi:uncharacterized delta-60 repeat protein